MTKAWLESGKLIVSNGNSLELCDERNCCDDNTEGIELSCLPGVRISRNLVIYFSAPGVPECNVTLNLSYLDNNNWISYVGEDYVLLSFCTIEGLNIAKIGFTYFGFSFPAHTQDYTFTTDPLFLQGSWEFIVPVCNQQPAFTAVTVLEA